jgi:hypothetical protein
VLLTYALRPALLARISHEFSGKKPRFLA